MNSPPDTDSKTRSGLALLGLVFAGGVAFLALNWAPDGNEHATLAQFVGRFHPLLVHVPIAFLLLVPVLEIAGMPGGRAHLRAAAGFVMALAAAGALAAAFDGWLLAWSGGYRGRLVNRHMWGGIALAAACVAAAWMRGDPGSRSQVRGGAYALLLAGTIGLMAWTSHQGGSLSQGESFLTERMPARLRTWVGLPPATRARTAIPGAGSLMGPPLPRGHYAAVIAPIFERSCISCHRPAKHKGGLRMDTYGQLMNGGEDGPVIEPGNPVASELIRRVSLPIDDDDSMPGDGKKPLTPAEIQRIGQWIAAGARGD